MLKINTIPLIRARICFDQPWFLIYTPVALLVQNGVREFRNNRMQFQDWNFLYMRPHLLTCGLIHVAAYYKVRSHVRYAATCMKWN